MPIAQCCLLLLVAVCSQCLGSRLVYHNEDSQPNELDMMELFIGEPARQPLASGSVNKRSELYDKDRDQKQASGLWFGPRLGRRRRSDGTQQRAKRSIDDTGPRKETLYLGQDGQWALMSFGGSKRDSNFTPRLGRRFDDDAVLSFMEPMFGSLRGQNHQDVGGQNSGPDNFSPRLGRLAPLGPH